MSIEPKLWEGNVAIVETKTGSGVFTLKPRDSGKYSVANVDAALKAILTAKVKFDGWKVWLDGAFDTTMERGEELSPSKLAKIVKEADHVALVYVKRPFPQPKLKFTKGGGNPTRTARTAAREL